MTRPAWLLWRAGSRAPSPMLVFDSLPGRDAREYGPRILAEHPIPAPLAERLTLDELAELYPPPVEAEAES